MVKVEKKSSKQTSAKSSWWDKITYSLTWFNLIQKASSYRAAGDEANYINTIDAIIPTLLKKEREPIKKRRTELKSQDKFGFHDNMVIYDQLLEDIVDILEDSGYLTKEILIDATTVRLEPDED